MVEIRTSIYLMEILKIDVLCIICVVHIVLLWDTCPFYMNVSSCYYCVCGLVCVCGVWCVCVYLVLDEGVDPLQHAFTGELVGQVGFNLEKHPYT